MARETAEEKFRRLIREEMASERQRESDEKNPGISTLRRIIQEELAALKGDGSQKREEKAEEDKAGEDIWATLGLK